MVVGGDRKRAWQQVGSDGKWRCEKSAGAISVEFHAYANLRMMMWCLRERVKGGGCNTRQMVNVCDEMSKWLLNAAGRECAELVL